MSLTLTINQNKMLNECSTSEDQPPNYDSITIKMTFFDIHLKNQTHIAIRNTFEQFAEAMINKGKVSFITLWPNDRNEDAILDIMTDVSLDQLGWNINAQSLKDIHHQVYQQGLCNFLVDNRLYIHHSGRDVYRFDVMDIELEQMQVMKNELIQLKKDMVDLKKENSMLWKVWMTKCVLEWNFLNKDARLEDDKVYYTYIRGSEVMTEPFAEIDHIVWTWDRWSDNQSNTRSVSVNNCRSCSGNYYDSKITEYSNYLYLIEVLEFIDKHGLKYVNRITVQDDTCRESSNYNKFTESLKHYETNKYSCRNHAYEISLRAGQLFMDVKFTKQQLDTLMSMNELILPKLDIVKIHRDGYGYHCLSSVVKPRMASEVFPDFTNITWIDN